MMKVGLGVDVHAFADHRKCIIGGVHIPHPRGLLGHSDADVLTHAVMDALLGTLGERDIGHFFPDTDSKWKDANSIEMLRQVGVIMRERGAKLHNIDITIIAQEPKLSPHIDTMRANLAGALNAQPNQFSIKATTSEWMGFTGRKEGILAMATALADC